MEQPGEQPVAQPVGQPHRVSVDKPKDFWLNDPMIAARRNERKRCIDLARLVYHRLLQVRPEQALGALAVLQALKDMRREIDGGKSND
jgi:hypothetical protein